MNAGERRWVDEFITTSLQDHTFEVNKYTSCDGKADSAKAGRGDSDRWFASISEYCYARGAMNGPRH